MPTLIYTDPKLVTSIGATYGALKDKLYTPERFFAKSASKIGKLVQPSSDAEIFRSTIAPISVGWSDILPEVAIEQIIEAIFSKPDSPKEFVSKAVSNDVHPGSITYLLGTIVDLPPLDIDNFDPNKDSYPELPCVNFHGDYCFIGKITERPYYVLSYFSSNAVSVLHANNQMTRVLGICKWLPWYRPGSGSPISLGIRVAAVWLE